MHHFKVLVTWRGLYVCPFVTLVHLAKTVGRNEMLFGRGHSCGPMQDCIRQVPSPPREGEIWSVGTASSQRCRLSPNYFSPCYTGMLNQVDFFVYLF